MAEEKLRRCTTSDSVLNVTMAVGGFTGIQDPQTDAIWILSSTFIVFTMQSGFGLLESGSVSVKNELNIMVKNAVDVVFGGLTYWAFGYGLTFGEDSINNPVFGWGSFFVNCSDDRLGVIYAKFFFQASFATTATTIVSGAMAERTKLNSYMIFSMINTVLFSLPAHWIWATKGWLYTMGVVDVAGAGPVHLVGGMTGLVATLILKPRHLRYNQPKPPQMSSPTNAVLGMFMLWWGWLGFNCGSTFGISGNKWKLAARSAASTLCSSVAGGVAGFALSFIMKDRKFDVAFMINGILGSLVSVTACCALVQPWEGLVIGFAGSLISNLSVHLLDKLKIDDPVGCVGTHAMSGAWGLLAPGLFIRKDSLLDALFLHHATGGVFHGGGFRQLGVQALAVAAIVGWSIIMSFLCLKVIDVTIGLRVTLVEEIIGADIVEHGIGNVVYDRRTERVYYPDQAETGSDIQSTEDLSSLHERELRVMRDRSLSNFSHLLGHSVRRRTVTELNREIANNCNVSRSNSQASRCSPVRARKTRLAIAKENIRQRIRKLKLRRSNTKRESSNLHLTGFTNSVNIRDTTLEQRETESRVPNGSTHRIYDSFGRTDGFVSYFNHMTPGLCQETNTCDVILDVTSEDSDATTSTRDISTITSSNVEITHI